MAKQIVPTPDGRYLVIDGVLWRRTNPNLPAAEVERLKSDLGKARSDVGAAKRAGDDELLKDARRRVHAAKVALGERGPTWWDGEDFNRHKVENTPYATWWAQQ